MVPVLTLPLLKMIQSIADKRNQMIFLVQCTMCNVHTRVCACLILRFVLNNMGWVGDDTFAHLLQRDELNVLKKSIKNAKYHKDFGNFDCASIYADWC